MAASNYGYAMRVAIAVDQLANALLGGDPDETLSARLHRHRNLPGCCVGRVLVDALFFWQWRPSKGGHCQQAWRSEMNREQLHESYRETTCSTD